MEFKCHHCGLVFYRKLKKSNLTMGGRLKTDCIKTGKTVYLKPIIRKRKD
jgi:transposase-like protein